jgi:hypothetical protein
LKLIFEHKSILKIHDFRYLLIVKVQGWKVPALFSRSFAPLRMTVYFGIIEGERRGDSKSNIVNIFIVCLESPLLSPNVPNKNLSSRSRFSGRGISFLQQEPIKEMNTD